LFTYLWLSVLIFISIFILLHIIKRKKYTKEKFAFKQMRNLFGFSIITVVPIISGNSTLSFISKIINEIFNLDIDISSSYADKILSVLILFGLIWIINKINSNWDGKISERSYQLERDSLQTGLLLDAIAQMKNDNVQIHKKDHNNELFIKETRDIQDMKTRIANLLMAYSTQYRIDVNEDWYEEFECFLSTYGKDSTPVLVHCPSKTVTIDLIEKLRDLKPGLDFSSYNYTLICKSTIEELENIEHLNFNNIKVYTVDKLLDELLNIPSYKDFITKKISKELLPGGCNLTLNDTYIDSRGEVCFSNETISVVGYIEAWLRKDRQGHLAILGEYGQGKSTLSYMLAYKVLNYNKIHRLPVVLELRGKSPRTCSLDELVFTWCNNFGITPAAFHSLNAAGRLVVILEGFDEMDLVGDAEMRMAHFRSLWRFAEPYNAKIMFTGRPNFFFDQGELSRALVIKSDKNTNNYCTSIRLLPFDNNQVKKALRSFPMLAKQSLYKIVTSPTTALHISELLRRPSVLIWAATAWEKLKEAFKHNQIASANVIGAILEQSYDRQLNKNLTTSILASEREFLVAGIALKMHETSPGVNQISSNNLKSTIEELITKIPDSLRDFAEVNESVLLKIDNRFGNRHTLIDTVLTDVRTSGVLVEDLSRTGYFKFAHKSFYEYYIATTLAFKLLKRSKNNIVTSQIIGTKKEKMYVPLIENYLGYENTLFTSSVIMQFTGQIYAQNLSAIFKDKNHKEIASTLFKELTSTKKQESISRLVMNLIKTFNMYSLFSNNIEKIKFGTSPTKRIVPTFSFIYTIYFYVLFSYQIKTIKIWYFSCISLGVNDDVLSKFLGNNVVKSIEENDNNNQLK
jgi:hypothetical protein